jgi:hypothetical protein
MAEEINLAGLLRPGDRLAWSAGPVEPVHLLGVLDRQLDRAPRVSALLNVSFQTIEHEIAACLPTDRGRCDATDRSRIIARCCVGGLDDQARSGLALGHTGRSRR